MRATGGKLATKANAGKILRVHQEKRRNGSMSAENRQKTAMREGIRYSVVFAAMLLLLAVLAMAGLAGAASAVVLRRKQR